ncbi:MAG: CoB--CoM heterodisulfide reductase iron-sulfur subunit A family protein [Candidatus Bathyarchaeia archaeon]
MTSDKKVLVLGGGIAGIQASLDLANTGYEVYLVEKTPSIGGRMAQLDNIFPTLEPSMKLLMPKMMEVLGHANIKLFTNSEVTEFDGTAGNYEVTVSRRPRYVDEERCTGCGKCIEVCPVNVPDEFNLGLRLTKAISLYSSYAIPKVAIINPKYCLRLSGKEECDRCFKVCEPKAINFEQKTEDLKLKVGAVILAVGADIFDASKAVEFGYGRLKNVISHMELERILETTGPTDGRILCPHSGNTPKSIVFVLCVGCRDKRFYSHCCNVGCMVSIKQAITVKERLGEDVDIYVCFNDIRAFGRNYEEFYEKARDLGINFVAGIPAEVRESPDGTLYVGVYEKILNRLLEIKADLVVLISGVVPKEDYGRISQIFKIPLGPDGFFLEAHPKLRPFESPLAGVYLAGACQGPKSIAETVAQASGAAAKVMALLAKM